MVKTEGKWDDETMAERMVRHISWASLTMAVVVVLVVGHQDGGDKLEYLQAADALLGDGSYSEVRYPPGFPAVLAPLQALGLPVWLASTGAAVALVVLVWLAAMKLAGPVAGVAAGVLCSLSSIVYRSGVLLMSDAQAAALVVGALVAILYGRRRLAGVLVGLSAWTRLGHALFVAALPRWGSKLTAAAVIAPLVLFNLSVWGSLAGYSDGEAAFSLTYLTETDGVYQQLSQPSPWTTLEFYPLVLFGMLLGRTLPVVAVVALVELWRRRGEDATRFTAGVVGLNVALYLPYLWQSQRFVLPAYALLVVYASSFVGRVVGAGVDEIRASRSTPGPSGEALPSHLT